MKLKKILFILLGCIGLGVGAIGAVMPLLPAFPFLLLAAFCFAKSSEKLHAWFIGTRLYKQNLESYLQGHGMTRAAKRRVMGTVTLIMTISCMVMLLRGVYLPCVILGAVWLGHILYFTFGVKRLQEDVPAAAKPQPYEQNGLFGGKR